ncbi:MAG: TolC family protein [Nitrosomonadales bacterium]|nr:TolC family protein [Nitrosomonadales bacterium]
MMKFKMPALAVLLLMAGAAAQAQPAPTFEQVLQSAMDSHPAIMGKRSSQAAARADQKGAEWLRYPTPSIEAATQSGGKDSGLMRIEQPLWSGGRITAAIDAAGSRLDAADAALNEAKLDLTLKVIAAYTEALRQKARQQFAQAGVDEHRKLLAMIRRRVEQEVSSLTDQRLAESRLYQADNDLSQITQTFQNALAQLAQLSGNPVADVSGQGVSAPGAPASLEAALSQALAYSPTLRRLVYEEEAANADIDSKRSVYMPQLSLRLEKNVGQGLAQSSSAMLVLQAQPGAGLSAGSGVDAAIARREAARMAREAAERGTNERITLDWNEWVAAQLRQENAILSRAMSADVFESYTRQYVIGRKSWIDVLNAVREATQSQFALEDARTQAVAAGLRLRAQAGALAGMANPR